MAAISEIAEAYLRGEWDTPDLTQFCIILRQSRSDPDDARRHR